MQPKSICLHFRNDKFVSKARQGAFPFTSSLTSEYILRHAEKLLKEFAEERERAGAGFGKCTNLSVQLQSLERIEKGQKGIQAFLASSTASDLAGRDGSSLTGQHDKRCFAANADATTGSDPISKRRKMATCHEEEPLPPKRTSIDISVTPPVKQTSVSFRCSRCKEEVIAECPADTQQKDALRRVRQVHNDEHYAREVLAEGRVSVGGSKSRSVSGHATGSRKKNGNAEPKKGTLQSFFAKK